MIKTTLFVTLACLSFNAFSDGTSYGGRHEISIDGVLGSIRHVHDWSSKKISRLFLSDLKNPQRIFSDENDFSYVEFVDRKGKVRFHYPSPAYTDLWSYRDMLYVGLSYIKLYNPYQIVVWDTKGKVLYKAHFAATVAKFTTASLDSFKQQFPQADAFLKDRYFTYQGITYCDFSSLGIITEIGEDAWHFLSDIRTAHPYIKSAESTSNYVFWYDTEKQPTFEHHDTKDGGKLTIYLEHGEPLVIEIADKLQQTLSW